MDQTAPAIDSGAVTHLRGSWTLSSHRQLKQLLAANPVPEGEIRLKEISALDTAGAMLLAQWLGVERLQQLVEQATELQPERRELLRAVVKALLREQAEHPPQPSPLIQALAYLGQQSEIVYRHFWELSGFIGLVLQTLFSIALRPWRWRITALVNQIHETGFNAVPIVALLTFLVGAVVAILGATVLGEFGALRTLGLSPLELLVVPRVLALLITLPLLTFVAVISGLTGGALVALVSLDIPLSQFFGILADVPLKHYLVGLVKAPLFAFVVAVIGCMEGFKVSGSAESVGRHTTSAVVQSIFMVILLDALAALFFMEMGW
jgi:phospholipid/cholesterol/gamma-HCH transport system permease protein